MQSLVDAQIGKFTRVFSFYIYGDLTKKWIFFFISVQRERIKTNRHIMSTKNHTVNICTHFETFQWTFVISFAIEKWFNQSKLNNRTATFINKKQTWIRKHQNRETLKQQLNIIFCCVYSKFRIKKILDTKNFRY